MKIIDLLNKIANGEEVPKKFEVNGRIWEWNVHSYKCELHSEFSVTGLRYDLSNLNDEIKILDIEYLNNDLGDKLIKPFLEEKKIPEKLKDILRIDDLIPPVDENMYRIWKQVIKNYNKLNEICDYLESKGE